HHRTPSLFRRDDRHLVERRAWAFHPRRCPEVPRGAAGTTDRRHFRRGHRSHAIRVITVANRRWPSGCVRRHAVNPAAWLIPLAQPQPPVFVRFLSKDFSRASEPFPRIAVVSPPEVSGLIAGRRAWLGQVLGHG